MLGAYHPHEALHDLLDDVFLAGEVFVECLFAHGEIGSDLVD